MCLSSASPTGPRRCVCHVSKKFSSRLARRERLLAELDNKPVPATVAVAVARVGTVLGTAKPATSEHARDTILMEEYREWQNTWGELAAGLRPMHRELGKGGARLIAELDPFSTDVVAECSGSDSDFFGNLARAIFSTAAELPADRQSRLERAAKDQSFTAGEALAAATSDPEFTEAVADLGDLQQLARAAKQDYREAVSAHDAGRISVETVSHARAVAVEARAELAAQEQLVDAYRDTNADYAAATGWGLPVWKLDHLGELSPATPDELKISPSDVPAMLGVGGYVSPTVLAKKKFTPSEEELAAREMVREQIASRTGAAGQRQAWTLPMVVEYASSHAVGAQVFLSDRVWAGSSEHAQIRVDAIVSFDGSRADALLHCAVYSDKEYWEEKKRDREVAKMAYAVHHAGLPYGVILAKYNDGDTECIRVDRDDVLPGDKDARTIAQADSRLAKLWAKWSKTHREGGSFSPAARENKTMFSYSKPKVPGVIDREAINDLAAWRGITPAQAEGLIAKIPAGTDEDTGLRALFMEFSPVSNGRRRFVTLDFETSALDPTSGSVIETGLVVTDSRGMVREFGDERHGIDDRLLRAHGTGAEAVHRISPADIFARPRFEESAIRDRIRELVADPDVTFVAHNASFEKNWLRASGIDISGRVIDTMMIRRKLQHGSFGAKNSDFCADVGVFYDPETAHSALGDARMSSQAFHNYFRMAEVQAKLGG